MASPAVRSFLEARADSIRRCARGGSAPPSHPAAVAAAAAAQVCLWQKASPVDSLLIMWSFVMGAVQIFWAL